MIVYKISLNHVLFDPSSIVFALVHYFFEHVVLSLLLLILRLLFASIVMCMIICLIVVFVIGYKCHA
jgi:hypothetical protein